MRVGVKVREVSKFNTSIEGCTSTGPLEVCIRSRTPKGGCGARDVGYRRRLGEPTCTRKVLHLSIETAEIKFLEVCVAGVAGVAGAPNPTILSDHLTCQLTLQLLFYPTSTVPPTSLVRGVFWPFLVSIFGAPISKGVPECHDSRSDG